MCCRGPIVRFRGNGRQAIVNGTLPRHREKCRTQVHFDQHQRYEQHEAGGSLCNRSSHVESKYSVMCNYGVSAWLVALPDKWIASGGSPSARLVFPQTESGHQVLVIN